ncbi:MAG: HAMP domain-containing protein [Polyangiaceae bacterium]|nr:HAMP domain-containing protein [Polyangiaceae bacterium]
MRPARTVARRILASYAAALLTFACAVAYSIHAQKLAADDALLLRRGYVPLLLSLGAALEAQNLVSAQLNHITDARNPADARGWIETQRKLRPHALAAVRAAADRGVGQHGDQATQRLAEEVARDVGELEVFLGADGVQLGSLFEALERGERAKAEEARDRVLAHELEGAKRLRELARRVERSMDDLLDEIASRERRALWLAAALGAGTLLVGAGLALYARRVLSPLGRVTARALAVARGDLTPRDVEPSDDEIGELAATFENMVGAIARARAEVVQAERLAAVGRMAAQITHEVRSPLSALGLNVELLEEEIATRGGGDEERKLVSAIRGEIDRLTELSERYLSLARRPTPEPAPGDLGALVREIARFVEPQLARAGVTLELQLAPGLPHLRFDEGQLRQAILNLIRNATEAMSGGGALTLSVLGDPGGQRVMVDDDGPGVPAELADTLFDPFVSTKRQGTGLGLSITRDIVESHGGRITAEPRAPRGTRFVVTLPEA